MPTVIICCAIKMKCIISVEHRDEMNEMKWMKWNEFDVIIENTNWI